MLKIFPVETDKDIELAKDLFIEYADSLGFDLCFQSFEQELANLPSDYSPILGDSPAYWVVRVFYISMFRIK